MTLLETLFGAPSKEWLYFGFFLVGIVGFIAAAEKTRSRMGWSPEVNRKLVHILTGLLICVTPFVFKNSKPLVWMAVLFIVVNGVGIHTGRLQGMHGTSRHSYGTIFYPLTFLILVLLFWPANKAILILSMLILAIADAAAAIVGENLRKPHTFHLGRDIKSLEGSAAMFLTSFILVLFLLPLLAKLDRHVITWEQAAWAAGVTALLSSALEALSSRGSDNLTAPLGAAFVLHFFITNWNSETVTANTQFTIGLGLALAIALLSYGARFLTASGAVGTFLLATLIFGIGGWIWAVPILAFFLLSSLMSHAGKSHKLQFNLIFEKSSRRDIGQVLANGGAAGTAMLCHYFFHGPEWYLIYLGSLAAVNSDTWATEIGVFSRTPPRSVKNFQRVPPGTSGGITPLGLTGALAGALVIALSGWLMSPGQISIIGLTFWIIVIAGFMASLADSLLGATLQAQYQCPVCMKITEKQLHCQGKATRFVRGLPWLNNDGVNAVCSFTGFFIVYAACTYISII
jgi:uncharacterized protein (TIGR00297 family)